MYVAAQYGVRKEERRLVILHVFDFAEFCGIKVHILFACLKWWTLLHDGGYIHNKMKQSQMMTSLNTIELISDDQLQIQGE